MGAGVLLLLLLFDFDFFDTLRTSSSRIAISSLALSSSSLVFRRPLSIISDGSNSIASIETATACSTTDEGVERERFKGAGAGLRKLRDGGLGKLFEFGIGVASTMETTGASVRLFRGGGVAADLGGVGGVTAFGV